MYILSLGGVGGCELGRVCRFFNGQAHPFDWNVVRHDFVQDVINSMGNIFFRFTPQLVLGTMIKSTDKRYILLHDKISDLPGVQDKYTRRLERLLDAFKHNKSLLCLRIMCCVDEPMDATYRQIFDVCHESANDWIPFINKWRSTNPSILLILFEKFTMQEILNPVPGVIVVRTPRYKDPKCLREIVSIIVDSMEDKVSQ